jgi:putative transposase
MTAVPPRRKSLRLPDFDYSQSGAYFVTTCIRERRSLLGKVMEEKMILNNYGQIVADSWKDLAGHFSWIALDYFTVMPNHFHGIIFIVGAGSPRPDSKAAEEFAVRGGGTPPLRPRLGQIVGYFKYQAARRINEARKTAGDKLWQRGYYEHVIRDDEALNRVREYIAANPRRWQLDRENPQGLSIDDFDRWLGSYKSRPSFAQKG